MIRFLKVTIRNTVKRIELFLVENAYKDYSWTLAPKELFSGRVPVSTNGVLQKGIFQ